MTTEAELAWLEAQKKYLVPEPGETFKDDYQARLVGRALISEVEKAWEEIRQQREEIDQLYKRLKVDKACHQAEVHRLREALEWYADKDNYFWFESEDGYMPEDVVEDGGERARKALKND